MVNKDYLIGFKPQISTRWNIGRCEKGYGTEGYPGRCPAQVIKNLLWYYTNEGDMVLDPMAGGGTTLDVCKEWKRKCISFDIDPKRPDIVKRDILMNGLPSIQARLIILDPPYANAIKSGYSGKHTDLGMMEPVDFYYAMRSVVKKCYKCLQWNGYLALIIAPWRYKVGIEEDLSLKCYNIFIENGYKLIERTNFQFAGDTGATGFLVATARKSGFMLRGFKDIMIFCRKDFDPTKEKFKNKLYHYDAREYFK